MQATPNMTADLRARIRAAVDAHARQRRETLIQHGELNVCAGCGTERENHTQGCHSCANRHYKWGRRDDPAFLDYERSRQRVARARRRAKAAA